MDKQLLELAKEYVFIQDTLKERDKLLPWEHEELTQEFTQVNLKVFESPYSLREFSEAVNKYREMTIGEYVRIMKGEKV